MSGCSALCLINRMPSIFFGGQIPHVVLFPYTPMFHLS